MDKDDLFRKADDPKYIPDIYNYCDRWCERCPFTARCLNFEIGEEQFSTSESRDIQNKEFWEQLSDLLISTIKMVKQDLEERGFDISEIDNTEFIEKQKKLDDFSENHFLAQAADKYSDKVTNWFKQSDEYLKQKDYNLEKLHKLGVKSINEKKTYVDVVDAFEVIHWYQYQIEVKLQRALQGKQEEMEEAEEYKDFPSDVDGSAKVALIGIDRSIAAWGKLYEQFSEKEDSILDILVLLEKLRKGAEKEFPKARAFVRPGFDEVV